MMGGQDERIDKWMVDGGGCMNKWMYGWMDDGWMDGWMFDE